MILRWRSTSLATALAALALSTSAAAAETVASFSGTSSSTTAEFEVEAPWILDWRVTTDGVYELAVEVSLEEAGTSVHQGRVLMTKQPGNGVRLFKSSGRYYFRVDSSFAAWRLTVRQLTEQEAAQYTPREPSLLD